jgi:outer membrane protein TolC
VRILYFLLGACALSAQTSLPSLIDSAQKNGRIESYVHQSNAAKLGYESAKYSYFPRIDGFGNASFVDHTGGFDAKQSYSGGFRGEFIVYDGSKRENLLEQHKALENAAQHTLYGAKKELSLDVIQRYFELQNTQDEIKSYTTMAEHLEGELHRLEKFKIAGLVSEDSLMRLRAEVSNARYGIEDLKYRAERQKRELETITDQTITELASSELLPPKEVVSQELDKLNALKYTRDAKVHEAKQKDAANLPTIKLEDHYSVYDYKNDPIPQMRVDTQNKFIASLTLNLVDFSAASTAKQALMVQAQGQSSELAYAAKEIEDNRLLAGRYIERTRILIDASEKSFEAATKTYDTVKKKYEARIVDYVTYLDALHTLTDAANQLSRAKRTLHIAYAAYYFYAGLDPKEFVR